MWVCIRAYTASTEWTSQQWGCMQRSIYPQRQQNDEEKHKNLTVYSVGGRSISITIHKAKPPVLFSFSLPLIQNPILFLISPVGAGRIRVLFRFGLFFGGNRTPLHMGTKFPDFLLDRLFHLCQMPNLGPSFAILCSW